MNGEYEQHIVKELCPTVGVQEVEVGVPVCVSSMLPSGLITKAEVTPLKNLTLHLTFITS